MTRKEFLLAGAFLTLAGCGAIPPEFRPSLRRLEPESGPFQTPDSDSVGLISHVLDRLSFGPRAGDYGRVAHLGSTPEAAIHAFIEEQLSPESIDDSALDHAIRRIEVLSEPLGELFEYKEKILLSEITRAALQRAVWSKRQLYEKMVHFWTDHLNIDSSKGDCKWLKAADDRDVIRRHAMSSFPQLLRASALSPAMLWYLDGRVNRKQNGADKPNENYARELLELHTLGIHGGYTQRDVMEVARCLTGWTVRTVGQLNKGRVEFHAEQHDDGAKTVLGQNIPAGLGEKDFERVLDIAGLHPATGRHIAEKLCRHFISDEPPAAAVDRVRDAFLEHRGEIRPTLRALFQTREFRAARRTKVKRPFEFMTSGLRQAAQLIKARVGLEAVSLDLNGWDSHFAQSTIMNPLMKRLSTGLAAFYSDLGAAIAQATVVVMTEFGRRVQENSSFGTDHGMGSAMMVIGGGIRGGRVVGKWPGLSADFLAGPGDLQVVHNYRDVLAPILLRHGATQRMKTIFPDFNLEPMDLYG